MKRQVPDEAFAYYVALGPGRSYAMVAEKYSVSRRTILRAADRDQWSERLQAIEKEARAATDKQLARDLQDMSMRHRKLLLAMASRAAKAIQDYPLTSGMDGLRAASMVIKLERLVNGEATERTSVDIEQVVRREYQELLEVTDEPDEEALEIDDEGDDGQEDDSDG